MPDRRRPVARLFFATTSLGLILAAGVSAQVTDNCGTTERVSVASDGSQGIGFGADSVDISADGRFVAFVSTFTNLVPGDTNETGDIFVHDRETGTTERVSVASDGSEANGFSYLPAISADGRFVAFSSDASNLVPDDTNLVNDIFVHDRQTGITERVSVASDGAEANGPANAPDISADGRFVVFFSGADNLVPGDTSGIAPNIFVRDRDIGTTERVSVASDGTEANGFSLYPAISADGRFVAFYSSADNLVPDDTNFAGDVFVHDRDTGVTERVSVASDGTEAEPFGDSRWPAISADGRFVAFESEASNLVPNDTNGFFTSDIFVHDRDSGTTELVSVASDGSQGSLSSQSASISGDGRRVAFISQSPNLVPDDTNQDNDYFVHDRELGTTRRVSVASDCVEGDHPENFNLSDTPSISNDGRHVAFASTAPNLVPDDTNDQADAFVHTLPELALEPYWLDFGPVLLGQTRELSLTLLNTSLAEITVSEIPIPQAPFVAQGGTCDSPPFTLAPQASCTLAFGFAPTTPGSFTETLTLLSDAPSSPDSITLLGIGSEGALHFAPGVLDFGGVVVGADLPGLGTVTLTNAAAAAVEVSAVSAPAAPFAATGGTCDAVAFTLDPFASCTLDYSFTPTETGSFSDLVEVTGDVPGGPFSFTLQGEGLLLELTLTPDPLDFGEVTVGETGGPLSATVTNTGDVEVLVNFITEPEAPFARMPLEDTCGNPQYPDFLVLPPGTSCTLAYTFNPTSAGEASAEVMIFHTDPSPTTLTLQGTGFGAAIDVDPSSLSSVLPSGETETQSLTVANVGNDTLAWEVSEETMLRGGILRPTGRTAKPESGTPASPVAVEGAVWTAAPTRDETVASHRFNPSAGNVTITHSESLDIFFGNSLGCVDENTGWSLENHYLRTFTLTDFGILGAFDVGEVTFGIDFLTDTAPINVDLYTLEGEFIFDNLTPIGGTTETLQAQSGTLVTVPVTGTAPPGSTLVVDVWVSDLTDVPAAFFYGGNNLGETSPSWAYMPDCGTVEPVTFAEIGFPFIHLVMTVAGETQPLDCTLPSWIGVDPTSGSLPGGGEQTVDVTFDATGVDPGAYEATLCFASNDPRTPLAPVPLALTVTGSELVFDPQSVDFGEVDAGHTSPPQIVTLHAIGALDASGLDFQLLGEDAEDFAVDTSDCGTTLPGNEHCEVSVVFAPLGAGPSTAVLEVQSDDGETAIVELSGQGVLETEIFKPMGLQVDAEPIISDANGVFEPGELAMVAPIWRNDGVLAQFLDGTAADLVGPEGPTYSLLVTEADYGEVDSGATASCQASELCYQMDIGPAVVERPAPHWDATFQESLSDETTHGWTLHIGDSFADVARASPFYSFIETLLHNGVTGGCSSTEYCPAANNTRAQMSVFVLRAKEGGDYAPPACEEGSEVFGDVPFSHPICPWIEELANRGVVSGCGGGNYCPGNPVTRAQMSIFLLRTLEGSGYTPPACSGLFADVACPSTFGDWIEDLYNREITSGCSSDPLAYCPANRVNRQQMAVFVTRTFGLDLYGP